MTLAELPDPAGRDLTPRQRKIMQVIQDAVQRDGYPPTLREIGNAAGLASASSVSHQLSVPERKGYLSRGAGRPRTAVVCLLTGPGSGQQSDPAHGDDGQQRIA